MSIKAVQELGLKKSIRFAIYSFLQVFYHQLTAHLLPFPLIRKLFLIVLKARIGKDAIIMDVKFFNWHHRGPGGLVVGKDCFIGDEVIIDLYDEVILEDQVTLAQRVTVLTHLNVGYNDHPLQRFFPKRSKPVIFKTGSVVGAASIILPGVTIGQNSFVAAGSVATKNVPANTLVGGVPARTIRKIG